MEYLGFAGYVVVCIILCAIFFRFTNRAHNLFYTEMKGIHEEYIKAQQKSVAMLKGSFRESLEIDRKFLLYDDDTRLDIIYLSEKIRAGEVELEDGPVTLTKALHQVVKVLPDPYDSPSLSPEEIRDAVDKELT